MERNMQIVTIRVKGMMDEGWSEWFEDFEITYRGSDETVLTGQVPDQAAFYGLIGKLRDLGIQLIAVNSIEQPDQKKPEEV
jgi:hypothetical protein